MSHAKWTEYDPYTGVTEINRTDELTGQVHVTKVQDVEDLVEDNKALANDNSTDIGIKKGFWCYMRIPLTVQYEILQKYGVNVHNRNHWPKLFSLVNEHYPYLKTTHKKHEMRGQGKIYGAPNGSQSKATSTKPGGLLIAS